MAVADTIRVGPNSILPRISDSRGGFHKMFVWARRYVDMGTSFTFVVPAKAGTQRRSLQDAGFPRSRE